MNLPKSISLTQPTKRFISFIIDFAVAALVGFVLFAFWGSRGLFESLGGKDLWNQAMDFYGTSHLYSVSKNDDGTWGTEYGVLTYTAQPSESQSLPGYSYYLDATYLFYTDFLPNNGHVDPVDGVEAKDYYNGFFYNTKIIGLPSDLTKIDLADPSTYTTENGFFSYALNSDGTAIDEYAKPVLSSTYQTLVNGDDREAMTKLYQFFLSGSTTSDVGGVYYEAAVLLSKQSYLPPIAKAYNLVNWTTNAVSFSIPLVVFFLLIPMVTPNGESLGKLITKTMIIKNNGTKLSVGQRLLRPWIVALSLSPFVFIPRTYQLFALAAMMLLLFVNFTFALRDKTLTYRTLQDRLCKTFNVEKGKTIVFNTEEEAKKYALEHNFVESPTNEVHSVLDSDAVLAEKSIIDLDSLTNRNDEIISYDSFEERKDD